MKFDRRILVVCQEPATVERIKRELNHGMDSRQHGSKATYNVDEVSNPVLENIFNSDANAATYIKKYDAALFDMSSPFCTYDFVTYMKGKMPDTPFIALTNGLDDYQNKIFSSYLFKPWKDKEELATAIECAIKSRAQPALPKAPSRAAAAARTYLSW